MISRLGRPIAIWHRWEWRLTISWRDHLWSILRPSSKGSLQEINKQFCTKIQMSLKWHLIKPVTRVCKCLVNSRQLYWTTRELPMSVRPSPILTWWLMRIAVLQVSKKIDRTWRGAFSLRVGRISPWAPDTCRDFSAPGTRMCSRNWEGPMTNHTWEWVSLVMGSWTGRLSFMEDSEEKDSWSIRIFSDSIQKMIRVFVATDQVSYFHIFLPSFHNDNAGPHLWLHKEDHFKLR